VAQFLRQFPWLLAAAQPVFRLTRPCFTAGVVGVVINDGGEVLLVEHVFHPTSPWGLPGGWVDRHEDPAQALVRELQEELELTAEVGQVLLVGAQTARHLDFAYLCRATGSVGALCSELLDYRWTALDHLPPLLPFHRRAVAHGAALLSVEFTGSPS
jgi:ADP-ribose pyrophosphatase YjhB (NUDIX family)